MQGIGAEAIAPGPQLNRLSHVVYGVLLASALALWWLCRAHPLMLPFWAPWDFSYVEFLSGWLAIFWYARGLTLLAPEERPAPIRSVAYFAGVLLIYGVLETRFEYFAEHQFFLNRTQHLVMHHVGPLLIAFAWPGAALRRGLPIPLRRIVDHPLAVRPVNFIQQPFLAAFLFSGSFFFWLIPAVHFRAMIDPELFTLMNWTMVIDGVLFWCLVLDPRPSPPARTSFAVRALLALAVMVPQIIGGAVITMSTRDLYSFYSLCGRIYPQFGPTADQAAGGMIIWLPPVMMSVLAVSLVLNATQKSYERPEVEGDKSLGHLSQPNRTIDQLC